MTKEELKKEAEEFLQKKWGTSKMLILDGDAREVLADFAEPREKQIEIDAKQIRALQKQNRELTDELTKKSDTIHSLVEQMADLESENAELKKVCDETQELLDKQIEATYKLDKEKAELKKENESLTNIKNIYIKDLLKAKEIIKDLCGMVRELNKPNVQLTNVDYSLSEAEQFISEVEK